MLGYFSKKVFVSLCFGIGIAFNSVSLAAPINYVSEPHVNLDNNVKAHVEWNKGEANDIQALGIGMAPAGSNHTRGKVLARRAAIVDAQRNLLEYINGVSLDADTKVENLAVGSDVIRTQVSGIIRGAKIVSERYNTDGSYEIVLSVPMYGANKSLASVVVPKLVAQLPHGITAEENVDNYVEKVSKNYTGVVVDAAGLGLETTFSPVIYDVEGRIVYGLQKVDHSFVINHGMVEYAKSIDAKGRAGTDPLIIKAVSVRGGRNSVNMVNVVVSKEDADKIIAADKKYGMLNRCAVVFVK